ncbi:unnamed protein product [Periconia digitata]|uniref:Major facilitator superfamily (MFS) profile domain-containing protein n=1 Tax=Periconia digitata TaxID=1303443 RepID=A0A9W4U1W7_9PLEO|nr:unnamed protein product [Periconia digitata]
MKIHAVAEEEMGLLKPPTANSAIDNEKQPQALSSHASGTQDKTTWRSLPQKNQLLLLALCRLSTPLSNACLLPYLYPLVSSILTTSNSTPSPQAITRQTGLLVAAYPLGQMCTSIVWGKLSDIYGRKPAILIGLLVSVIANFAFGFSTSIATLLFWRVVAGMANGILGVMRTMTTEIVREKRWNARAFLAMPVVFNMGRVVALVVGGCLADPVKHMKWAFGKDGVFNFQGEEEGVRWLRKYPYALPALFNAGVLAVCLGAATFGLRESLEERRGGRDLGIVLGRRATAFFRKRMIRKKHHEYVVVQDEDDFDTPSPYLDPATSTPPPKISPKTKFRDIWTRRLVKALVSFGLLPLHNTAFLHIFPVFLSMPIQEDNHSTVLNSTGGLGFSPPTVGLSLAAFGIFGIVLQLFLYPRIHKRLGTLGVFRLANFIFPLAYIFAPFLSLISTQKIARWPAIGGILFLQVLARTMAIPSSILLLTDAAPKRSVMGTVHGAGNTLGAFASAVGPAVGGVLLAKGIDVGAVGVVWWSWMLAVALCALAWSFMMRSEEDNEPNEKESHPYRITWVSTSPSTSALSLLLSVSAFHPQTTHSILPATADSTTLTMVSAQLIMTTVGALFALLLPVFMQFANFESVCLCVLVGAVLLLQAAVTQRHLFTEMQVLRFFLAFNATLVASRVARYIVIGAPSQIALTYAFVFNFALCWFLPANLDQAIEDLLIAKFACKPIVLYKGLFSLCLALGITVALRPYYNVNTSTFGINTTKLWICILVIYTYSAILIYKAITFICEFNLPARPEPLGAMQEQIGKVEDLHRSPSRRTHQVLQIE